MKLVDRALRHVFHDKAGDASRLQATVAHLIRQTSAGTGEHRQGQRAVFCYPATLCLEECGGVLVPAYVRDISTSGMGFKHSTALEPGSVTAHYQLPDGTHVSLHVRILWTLRLDGDWFISGGRFVDVADQGSPRYVLMTLSALLGVLIARGWKIFH